MRRIILAVLIAALLVVGWFLIGGAGPPHIHRMRSGAVHLQTVYRLWAADGKPNEIALERYVTSTNFYRHTNTYVINGKPYDSLCGYDSDYFRGKGRLVISVGGDVIWINDKNEGKLVH